MTPKNKKRFSRKGNKKWLKSNANNINSDAKREDILVARQNNKKLPNKNCLSLIERMANRLKDSDCTKFVTIIEQLLTIFQKDAKKRMPRLELTNILLSIVEECDVEDISDMKIELNRPFFPKELKNVMVKPSDLKEQLDFFVILGMGSITGKAQLVKDGRRIRVEMREAFREKDNFKVIDEAKLLSQLRHRNIIKIMAFDKTRPRFAVEYMKLGNLNVALEFPESPIVSELKWGTTKKKGTTFSLFNQLLYYYFLPVSKYHCYLIHILDNLYKAVKYIFTSRKLFSILKGVASALVYLSEREYVLRNLRSEHIHLDGDGYCKISDFHYCRYVGESGGIFVDPDTILDGDYAAPEVRAEQRFSTKSDSWDMALLACEVFNVNPEQAARFILPLGYCKIVFMSMFVAGKPFPLPYKCPYPLWEFFKSRLLDEDPDERPAFPEILEELGKYDSWHLD